MTLDGLPTSTATIGVDIARVVVVAPHPDDEVLACGLLLAIAARRRLHVSVLAVTDGEAAYPDEDPFELADVRRREQDAALAEIGVGPECVVRLGLPDGSVDEHLPALADEIRARCTGDTLLVAPSVHDWHRDHVACGRAARRVEPHRYACRWSSLFWAYRHPQGLIDSDPRLLRLEGSPRQQAARSRAVARHSSQFQRPVHGRAPILTGHDIGHLDLPIERYVQEHP